MSCRYLDAGADISACGLYRYRLWRTWAEGSDVRRVLFVMLNPSTADGTQDDPTLRRCVGFAQSWGFGALTVCNLFAFRATDPGELLVRGVDRVGPENDAALARASTEAHLVVAAWGAFRGTKHRAPAVLAALRQRHSVHAMGLTRSGDPKHPLYLPGHLQPVSWMGALT